ncbi:MAG: DUF1553 domain-containing protein [Planctomycetes bacterium]|nr:DUF1553 domain-containing protein [Planctomycetota bacterium]
MTAILVSLALTLPGNAADSPGDDTFFELKIRPVLAGTCFKCHGGTKTSAGLRVDSRAALLKGGDSGAAVVTQQPDMSLLIAALRHQGDIKMPPGTKLPDQVIADFERWIKAGAAWPVTAAAKDPFAGERHWAFQPLKKRLPPGDVGDWSSHPIDRFIASKWREHGLKPVRPANKRTLMRRVYFDLIGLPPTPQETAQFLNDKSQDAYENLIDRLLASPRYGERWGRHWMDVARYADTAGDNADYPIPEIHRYRDYIIDAFNNDKPFNHFIHEQIAGDILAGQGPPEKHAERVIATGFLALSRRYATAPYELWHLTLEDTIDTVGQAFLGLTMRCARCHDHKFDPVTTADYYGLYGMFASTRFPYAGSEEFASMKKPRQDFVSLMPGSSVQLAFKKHQDRLAKLQAEIDRLQKAKPGAARDRDLSRLRGELFEKNRAGLPPEVAGAYAVSEGRAADAHVQLKGEPRQRGPLVPRQPPKFLLGDRPFAIPPGHSGRLELAHWLTDNPLTPRVLVNRLWQHHFGKGIVATPNNFGLRGEPPSHPELLDYLAATFVERGWSIKSMHRFILRSKTYQLSCDEDTDNAVKDGGNRWLWRFERRRLDAEAIRDSLLAVSGTLDLNRPGAHPFPPIASWGWTQHNPFKDVYPSSHRSVYLMTQRLQRHPFLALFDGPDTNTTTEKRDSSTVPLQALFWMNSPLVKEQAHAFVRRLLAGAPDDASRIRLAHKLAYARPPRPEEIERGLSYLGRYADELRRKGATGLQIDIEAWASYARVLLAANEFIYVD